MPAVVPTSEDFDALKARVTALENAAAGTDPAPIPPPAPVALTVPVNFHASAADLRITLTCDAVPGAAAYAWYERRTTTGPVAVTALPTRTSGQLSETNPDYYYSVAARIAADGMDGPRSAELHVSSVTGEASNTSTPPPPVVTEPAPTTPPPPPTNLSRQPTAIPTIPSTYTRVNTAAELTAALAGSATFIVCTAGKTFAGKFVITRKLTLLGEAGAKIDGGAVTSGYALHVNGAPGTIVAGLEIFGAQKGVMVDASNGVKLLGLFVHHTGMEAIHLRTGTSDGEVSRCVVEDTSQDPAKEAGMGEGIYLGQAISNWVNGQVDSTNRTLVLANTVRRTGGECMDIKEGTFDGWIEGNIFDGGGMDGQHFADSCIDVKGNRYTVIRNVFSNGYLDCVQTHSQAAAYGHDNVFDSNTYENAPGYAVNNHTKCTGTVVRGTNTLRGIPVERLSNIS